MAGVCDAAVERARAAGVSGVLLAGVDAPGWRDAAVLQARLGDRLEMVLAYGVHPEVVGELAAPAPAGGTSRLDAQLMALARAARGEPLVDGEPPLPRPHAIGELGLDGRDLKPASPDLALQEGVFRAQLALAREVDLPLVLHVVRAHEQALRILKRDGVPQRGGVMHSYSGSAELAADYLRLGLYISFAGPVTYPEARRVHAAVKAVPTERLLVETDAPTQTPWARRPAAGEPAFLPDVLQALALHRGQPWTELAAVTEANARRLFHISKADQ